LEIVFPRNQGGSIKYFTAKGLPRPSDPDQPTRQETYLRALRTTPNLEIHYGHFLTHPVRLPLVHPRPGQDPFVEVFKTEEKGSDVNLATHLLHDAYQHRFECAIVVSGDSDLVEPVQGLYGAALGEWRAAPERLADAHTALGGAEKDGANGVPGRSVAVKEYDVFGHEVGGGHLVGPLRRVPM
jgi:hypothetical protein